MPATLEWRYPKLVTGRNRLAEPGEGKAAGKSGRLNMKKATGILTITDGAKLMVELGRQIGGWGKAAPA